MHRTTIPPIICLLLAYGEVVAAASDSPPIPAGGAGILIPFAIAYLSRRRAIGGWLFFFYLQLYLSFLVSLFFIPQVLTNLNPSDWDDSFLYVMFFLSIIPALVITIIEVLVATLLLIRKTEHHVNLLRKVLIVMVVTSGATVWIDYSHFKDDSFIIFDVVSFIFAVIWLSYFYIARRVKLVFVERT